MVEIKVPPDISSGNAANATREKRPAPAGKSEYNILTIGNLNRDGVTKYACFCRENSIFATSLIYKRPEKSGCYRHLFALCMVAVPETAARHLVEPRTPAAEGILFLNLQVMTGKQYDQFIREANRLESLCRGNELETPFVVLMRICRDYVEKDGIQRLSDEGKVRYLAERLDRFRIKYFAKI